MRQWELQAANERHPKFCSVFCVNDIVPALGTSGTLNLSSAMLSSWTTVMGVHTKLMCLQARVL